MLNKLLIALGISALCGLLPIAKAQAYQDLPIAEAMLLTQQNSEDDEFNELLKEAVRLAGENNDAASLRQAIATSEAALVALESVEGDKSEAQGVIFYLMGSLHHGLGEQQAALDYYQRALSLRKATGDKAGEELTLSQIGIVYEHIGDTEAAIDYYEQALAIAIESGHDEARASNLNSLGATYSAIGEVDTALDYYQQALAAVSDIEDIFLEATIRNNIGNIYESLGKQESALDYYQQALQSVEKLSDRTDEDSRLEATIFNNVGRIYDSLADKEMAVRYFNQALAIYKKLEDQAGIGGVFNNLGALYDSAADQETALTYYLQALAILQEAGKRDREAATLNNIGFAYSSLGDITKGVDYLQQALEIFREIGDYPKAITTLANVAFIEKEQGRLEDALETISAAIVLVEDLRNNISDSDLQTSYFATVQDLYELKTDLLMQLNRAEDAFEVSEAARGRLLIDLLNEANVDLRAGVAPELVAQETALRQELRAVEDQRIELLYSNQGTAGIADVLEAKSETVVQQLEQTLSNIRRESPSYAEIVKPSPLSIEQVYQTVLDDETVLLQYAVGEAKSYLWIVDDEQYEVYTLPGRAVIEEFASPFLSAISNSGSTASDINRSGLALAEKILPTLPEWTAGKRLLISGDDILLQVPYAALPLPDKATYTPLLVEHEVLSEPSISAVAVLREQFSNRPDLVPSVAILADPVYDANDKRVTQRLASSVLPEIAQITLRDLNQSAIYPLPYTRVEAKNIMAIASDYKTTAAYDFEANYDWITDPAISEYSILHLATHGLINPINPQFSGVVLSLVDANGRPRDNGFLQLHDIFNLKLAAELVVLSACETGLGKSVSGEGIMGLSRGFMYAGAERVAVSLWKINDEATASLMSDFYRYLLNDKLTPAAALRSAQLKAWQAGQSPYLWGAFTVQGEWQ